MGLLEDAGFLQLLHAIAPDKVLGCDAMEVPRYVAGCLEQCDAESGLVVAGFRDLNALAAGSHSMPLEALPEVALFDLLSNVASQPWFAVLARWVAEAIYADPGNRGNPDARSWAEVGYRHGLPEGPNGPPRVQPALRPKQMLAGHYDAIVVGAGAGGGIVASRLALGGLEVLLVERGHWLDYVNSGHRDHLRNHRNPVYGHNTGPDPDDGPRVLVGLDGAEQEVAPHTFAYSNNAACVGSGTLIYGGQAWRFHPDDFRMASHYGVPEGSSLVDWPVGYDELEQWYTLAEQEIGVAGQAERLPHEPWRSTAPPMPPMPRYETARVLQAGADRLGLSTAVPPLLINSVPRDGRAPCIECGSCVGFACPSDGKNGTQNTVLRKALATGRLSVITETVADSIETDSSGRVTGVRLVWEEADGRRITRSISADLVVLSAGAIETARLLLLSAHAGEPTGIGNRHDLVGRNLQGHTYPTAYGLFDQTVYASKGPGVTIATTEYVHGNPSIVGGAMLADDFVVPPIMFWSAGLPPDLPRWGQAPHDFMREHYRHVTSVRGPVHETPNPECRVELDPRVRDKWGRAVARLSGVVHPETQRTAAFILERAKAWLWASGAREVWGSNPPPRLSAYQHQAGTCRMGNDPTHSVTDAFGKVWGHDNLFIADASLHPTNGAFNPVLTIMALAFRGAEHILATLGSSVNPEGQGQELR